MVLKCWNSSVLLSDFVRCCPLIPDAILSVNDMKEATRQEVLEQQE